MPDSQCSLYQTSELLESKLLQMLSIDDSDTNTHDRSLDAVQSARSHLCDTSDTDVKGSHRTALVVRVCVPMCRSFNMPGNCSRTAVLVVLCALGNLQYASYRAGHQGNEDHTFDAYASYVPYNDPVATAVGQVRTSDSWGSDKELLLAIPTSKNTKTC